jgi:hypothetical protein
MMRHSTQNSRCFQGFCTRQAKDSEEKRQEPLRQASDIEFSLRHYLGNEEGLRNLFLDRSLNTFASSAFHLVLHQRMTDLSQLVPHHCFLFSHYSGVTSEYTLTQPSLKGEGAHKTACGPFPHFEDGRSKPRIKEVLRFSRCG